MFSLGRVGKTLVGKAPKHSLVVSFLLSAMAIASPPGFAADSEMLTIFCDGDLFSKSEVRLSALGFYVKSQVGSSLWLAKEPGKAYLINAESKVFLPVSLDEYVEQVREELGSVRAEDLKKVGTVSLPDGGGLLGTRYDGYGFPAFRRNWHHKPGRKTRVADFVFIDSTLPVSVKQAWCRIMGVDYRPKLTLPVSSREIFPLPRKQRAAVAEAGSAWPEGYRDLLVPRKIVRQKLDAKFFQIPKGYMKAKDRASLYLSVDGDLKKEDIEDLFTQPLK